ncbi:hypothetical protein PV08_10435 [Exophiala spinifera]|uniref:PNPLA domain-containing protein n=1 Tax=Exophiala spinifera TaxID=91928 RepID=A0A0D2AXH0_9EURO|nr:uncharacterized protein PV08_10435 [Exophiala spinifera]KIW11135.1 hypothetical protein PV08_10435 [Exophiala spinifera]
MSEQRPLKVLTLDGGGLQALATLSTLNSVCKEIAKQNEATRIPAPHELFDVICGVGTGGWIALLLGRYRLDIATCMAVYMEIARKVDCAERTSRWHKRNRCFKLDQDRLVTVIEDTLQRYDLDGTLLSATSVNPTLNDSRSRCKYAFAVGVVQQSKPQGSKYELFRSYQLPANAKDILPGPQPERCRVSQAFAATGAAKFFLKPYRLAHTSYFDETFPQSHPITAIALDEVFGLYGSDAKISILLNVGPGIPPEEDCRELDEMSTGPVERLARKFSWPKRKQEGEDGTREELEESTSSLSSTSERALRLDRQTRLDVKVRLKELYGAAGPQIYHHLGPDYSLEKASLNDVRAIRLFRSQSSELQASTEEIEGTVKQFWVNARA